MSSGVLYYNTLGKNINSVPSLKRIKIYFFFCMSYYLLNITNEYNGV